MSTKPIVAFCGPAQAGKSSAAKIIAKHYGHTVLKFARPMKAMMETLLREAGVDEETIYEMLEGSLKEVPCVAFGGKTPRFAMQTLGTEWGREFFGSQFWVNILDMKAKKVMSEGGSVVIEDVRFSNETKWVKDHGGFIVKVNPPLWHKQIVASGHSSETQPLQYDFEVDNHGTIEDMERRLIGGIFPSSALC